MVPIFVLCCFGAAFSPQAQSDAAAARPAVLEDVLPARTARPWTVAFEVGNSGLAGLGVTVDYSFTPHWAVDTGLGVSVFGLKAGVRGRYNLFESAATPFVALGAMLAAAPWETAEVVPMGQAVGGISWIADGGFSLLAAAGWMQRLDGEQGRWVVPIVWTGSDMVVSVATGYAF